MENKKTLGSLILILFFLVTSVISCFQILLDTSRPSYYNLLWALPATFFIITITFLFKWHSLYFTSITGFLVVGIYYIRFVVTPFIMSIGEYSSVIGEASFASNASLAIFLMVYEGLTIFLLMTAFIQKSNRIRSEMTDVGGGELLSWTNRPSNALWLIIGLMMLFIIYLIRSDPTIWKANFLLLIDVNHTYHAFSSAATGIGTLSMYVEIMNSMFKLIQVILPPMILYFIAKRNKLQNLKYVIAFALFLLVVVVATEDRIDAIFAGIALLFTVRDAFGVKFKSRFSLWLILIGIAALFGLAIKSGVTSTTGNNSGMRGASIMLCAYFSGVPTVAAGIGMADSLPGLNILHLFPDLVSKIPYFIYVLNMITGVKVVNSNQLFNNYISNTLGRGYAQILPSTAVGYEYVGFLFAPIIVGLFIKLALYFERNIRAQNDIVRRNLYYWITICVASSPVISSILLITAKLAWFYIALIIMAVLHKRREQKSR